MKKNFMLTLLVLFSLVFSALSQERAFAAEGKEILKIGISSEFETLHPLIAEQAATSYMLYLAWRPLVVLSLDYQWKPLLIKEIPTVKNKLAKIKGQGMEATLELLPEAQWGDGTPVTCKDLEFAWKVGKHPNVSVPSKEPYENISAITWDPASPKKCTFSFVKAKYNYFNSFVDPLPAHLEGPVFEKHKDQPQGYDHNTLYVKEPTNPGLYNGPFTIGEVKLGSHVIFNANPKFGGKKASLKQVIFKLIPNGATLTARLAAGDIDMIPPPGGLGFDQALAFEKKLKAEPSPFRIQFVDGVIYAHIDLNLDHPALAELPVRKALALTMNKKEMLQSFFEGKAKDALHFVTSKDPWYTDKVPNYAFNRREANKILDEAGWKKGANGIRAKDGKVLSFTILGAAGNKIVENIEAFLQAQWKSIGIEVRIKNEPARVFFGETTKKRRFDMALYSWVSVPENTPRTTLRSSEIPTEQNSWTGQNYPGYKNPEVDKLIDQLEVEFDAKKRAAIGRKIIEHYANDLPVLPVYYRPVNAVVPKDMKGYEPSGHLFYETLYAENWAR